MRVPLTLAGCSALLLCVTVATSAQRAAVVRGTGVLNGTVRDDAGRPVVYATVEPAYRFKRWNGPYYTVSAGRFRDVTDDRGAFRLHSLPAGTYVVVVKVGQARLPPPAEGTAYVETYFPSTASLADAQTITVHEHEEQSIDVGLAHVAVAPVSGVAIRSDGSPAAGYDVALLGTPTFKGVHENNGGVTPIAAGTIVARDGAFSMPQVPAGTYTLRVTNLYRNRASEPREVAWLPVVVGQQAIRDLKVVTAPGAVARGRIVWDEDPPQGPLSGRLRAALVGMGYDAEAAVREDGIFELTGLYGRVRFEDGLGLFRTVIKTVEAPASVTAGRYLNFTPGTSTEGIRIVMTRHVGRFAATALDDAGAPFAGGSVLLLSPSLDDVGSGAGTTGRGYAASQGSARGEYVIESVLPGSYLAVAIDIPPYLLNADADLMERARAAAVPVQLPQGETRQMLHVLRLRPFVPEGLQ